MQMAVQSQFQCCRQPFQDHVQGIHRTDVGFAEITLECATDETGVLNVNGAVQAVRHPHHLTLLLGGVFAGQHQHRITCVAEHDEADKGNRQQDDDSL
jgi:hypothetical protein